MAMILKLHERSLSSLLDSARSVVEVKSVRRKWEGGNCYLVIVVVATMRHPDDHNIRVSTYFNDTPVPCRFEGDELVVEPTIWQRVRKLAAWFGIGQAVVTVVYMTEG